MGRNIKQGLDYFMHDVDLSTDDKIELIEAECGLIGYAVVNKLLERIYRDGYYIVADDKFIKVFSKRLGIEIDECRNVINVCINEKFFNKNQYNDNKILTSAGIQKRYLKACERRKEINFDGKYLLLDEDDLNIYVNINIKNGNKSTQGSKGSKVKEVTKEALEFFQSEIGKRFLSHRKNVKAPISKDSYQHFYEKFQKWKSEGFNPEFVINEMIDRGWRGFKPEWINKQEKIGTCLKCKRTNIPLTTKGICQECSNK